MSATDDFTSTTLKRQDSVDAIEFLNHLFGGLRGDVFFELTLILPPERSNVGPSPITQSYRLGVESPEWEHVDELNQKGYGVYYALTPKKRRQPRGKRSKEADTACCQVLWADIDLKENAYKTKADAYQALCDFDIPPTVIIDSGGGLHSLWRIDPVAVTRHTLTDIKATLKGIALALKSDPHVAELARVFRLPGTINTKPERDGARCEIVDWLPGQYDYSTFADYTAMGKPPARRQISVSLPDGARTALPRWCREYLEHGAAQGNRNNRLFAAAVEYRANGYSQSDAERELCARALADGLGESEALKTIESAWRSQHGSPNVSPHIAARIAANGGDNA